MNTIKNKLLISTFNLSKSFGSIIALNKVNINLFSNEIVALVGDNGSGKSTLVKILSGVETPDEGSINIFGNTYYKLNTKDALSLGIATVYQNLALDNFSSTAENIFLGQEPLRFGFLIDKKEMIDKTKKLLKKVNIKIPDPTVPVGYLSGGQRQGVAISRCMLQNKQIIIFDEPTAAMGVKETDSTLNFIKSLKNNGHGILLISHNLFQVFDVANRIYVLSKGAIIAELNTENSCPTDVHKLIVQGELG